MKKANLIIKGGYIFQGKDFNNENEYIAIKDNYIVSIGKESELEQWVDSNTTIIELKSNQMVMPGFFDSHTHLLQAGMMARYVVLSSAASEEEAAEMTYKFSQENQRGLWMLGFGWYHFNWKEKKLPTRHSLDKFFSDRPVLLLNAEAHGAWVNSKALEIAGITVDTPDPKGGHIERDEKGVPTGYLDEMAVELVSRFAFALEDEQEEECIKAYMEKANAYGITAIDDMMPCFGKILGNVDKFHQMSLEGKLTIRVHAAVDLMKDLYRAEEMKSKYWNDFYRVCLLKDFVDGVIAMYSGALLEPYSDAQGVNGEKLLAGDVLRNAIRKGQKIGMPVRLHACGDGAVREALNAFEDCINDNTDYRYRHAIEHNEIVHPDDIGRFAQLGIIASMQPEHMHVSESFDDNYYIEKCGEKRCELSWPIGSMLKRGTMVAFGSDCPCVDNSPFIELYRAVTRKFADGNPCEGWNPKEKISMDEALHAYTYVPYFAVNREHELGTLEIGKLADLIVVNKNLLEIEAEDILNCQVNYTIVNGKIVFQQ